MLELSKIEEFFKCGVISITEVIKKPKKYGTVYFQHGFEKGTILFVTHKKWPFSSDFKVKCEKGEVISGVWKHCPEAEYNAFMCEARTRNIKDDSALNQWRILETQLLTSMDQHLLEILVQAAHSTTGEKVNWLPMTLLLQKPLYLLLQKTHNPP